MKTRRLAPSLAFLSMGLGIAGAQAQSLWNEELKLVASDAADGDQNGTSVAVSGDWVLSGAPLRDDGNQAGAAYLHNVQTMVEVKLTAYDADLDDAYGTAVAADGDRVAVGAPLHEIGFSDLDSGAVYVYRLIGGVWTLEQRLKPPDEFPAFGQFVYYGSSVDLEDDTLVVGAYGDDDDGFQSGAAFVYRHNGSLWVEDAKLTASDALADKRFGFDVGISGSFVVIGANGDNQMGAAAGAAYLFSDASGSWAQTQKLVASNGEASDFLGGSVAIDSKVIVLGASGNDDQAPLAGAAYVYQYSIGAWSEETILYGEGELLEHFGQDVAVNGNLIVVGATNSDAQNTNAGAAFLFRDVGPGWGEQHRFTASDGASFDLFGNAVDVEGSRMVAGAHNEATAGATTGSCYISEAPDVTLFIDPSEVTTDDEVRFHLSAGKTSQPLMLFAMQFDGAPFVQPLASGSFNSSYRWAIRGNVPPGLSGHSMCFAAFALDPHSKLMQSNRAELLFQ